MTLTRPQTISERTKRSLLHEKPPDRAHPHSFAIFCSILVLGGLGNDGDDTYNQDFILRLLPSQPLAAHIN